MTALADDLDTLARFSAGGEGVSRVAWSPELMAAYEWVAGRMEQLGLETEIDAAGNLIGRWDVGSGPATVIGSHLDTVPSGGRYDGALGVLAGVHAVRLLQARGTRPTRPVWVVAFMDEEGTRFGASLFGSRAFAGEDVSDLGDRADAAGVTLRDAMASCGFDVDAVAQARRIDDVGSYLELHIEQGPVLERMGFDTGVVTAIVGLTGMSVRYRGYANHAGTTPMDMRRDALAGAAHAILALRERVAQRDGAVATVGKIAAYPGGANVVPGTVEFSIDLRSPDNDELQELVGWARDELAGIATRESLELEIAETHSAPALAMAPAIVDALERAAAAEGAAAMRMPSGAGHDAMVIGRRVPAGMLFVPSAGGVSHNPAEHTTPEQCDLGARVLARALEEADSW
jgi:hydantoinase/carbamoylase family amidase